MHKTLGILLTAGLALLFAGTSGRLVAQTDNLLILKKKGYINKMHFLAGEPITFIRKGSEMVEERMIDGIAWDHLVLEGKVVRTEEIGYVLKTSKSFNFRTSGMVLLIAAPTYLLLGVVNSLIRKTDPVPTPGNLAVAGTLAAAGAVMPLFQVRKFKLGTRYTLKIVQTDPALLRQK